MTEPTETITYRLDQCSLGALLVATSDIGIVAIAFDDDAAVLRDHISHQFQYVQPIDGDDVLAQVQAMIEHPTPAQTFNLPMDMRGTTFQQRVWQAVRAIPFGHTRTYSEIAAEIGMPKAMRGVGSACAANPIAVIVPCHRVVRNSGSLAGYRWGVARKRALIGRELRTMFDT